MIENCSCGVCVECQWWKCNGELGGDPVPIGEVVDLRHGLANAIALLQARVIEDQPLIMFSKAADGRYRVEFDYDTRAVALLKATVPAPMRRWIGDEKYWAVSPEWTGPLASKLRNAGYEIAGLDEDTVATGSPGSRWPCRRATMASAPMERGCVRPATRLPTDPAAPSARNVSLAV